MLDCGNAHESADVCLTTEQALGQLIKLLPRGRAWRTDEDTPVRLGVLRAIASVYAYVEERMCDLRREFFCATEIETNDIWLEQYGLPSPCDPFPDLCAKVAAIGGTRCEYYVEIARLAGWSIQCLDSNDCGMEVCEMLCFDSQVGAGGAVGTLFINVDIGASPAFGNGSVAYAEVGCMLVGEQLGCTPDIGPLQCLLSRIVQAHLKINYIVVDSGGTEIDDYGFASSPVTTTDDYGLASDPVDEFADYGTGA
jgi:hypothetical protein